MFTLPPLDTSGADDEAPHDTIHLAYPALTISVFLNLASVSRPFSPDTDFRTTKSLLVLLEHLECDSHKSVVLERLYFVGYRRSAPLRTTRVRKLTERHHNGEARDGLCERKSSQIAGSHRQELECLAEEAVTSLAVGFDTSPSRGCASPTHILHLLASSGLALLAPGVRVLKCCESTTPAYDHSRKLMAKLLQSTSRRRFVPARQTRPCSPHTDDAAVRWFLCP